MSSSFRLSIAVPMRNEDAVVREFLARTTAVLDALPGGPHEIVAVDDGSTDRTLAMLEDAARQDPRLVVISLARNFGHQAALTAALDHVSGDAAMVMDADLQDPPEAIPEFVGKFNHGYDVVYAQRVRRKEPWPLRLCYFLFYRLLARLSHIELPVDSGDFGLMSRRVLDQLRELPEHHRYLRGLRAWVGFKQTGVTVERAPRHSGRTKYSLARLIALAMDGIFAFSIVPIRAAALCGVAAIGLSSLYLLYALYVRLLHQSPLGFTALIAMLTLSFGVMLFFLGVIGEYVGRIYEETKARPIYVIASVNGAAPPRPARRPPAA